VAAAGHLLDHCRPHKSGIAVVGRIDPPSGDAPPLHARCSVTLRRERGFYLAQMLAVTPPRLQGVHFVQQLYEEMWLGSTGNTEAIAWKFDVTQRGATSVDSTMAATTERGNSGNLPDWYWSRGRWRRPPGTDGCGADIGNGLIPVPTAPEVVFVSVCGR
jgi:hypothetical protein